MIPIKDLLESGNVTVAVSLTDLKEFAKTLLESTKQELQQQITDANAETYPSPDEVAKILDVDRSTLWRWHKKGYLCHNEVGGKRKYRMSDVNAILKGGK
ncbi:MAG: helix-turn-helix domain-containing protein [Petrimonas sp.]|nr:helix-turn-helix domain-containing protein [Petrimonas sp.]